ncbi:4Fe-4S dicluster domain-containing protein [Thiohalorhabdus methylotrophus]|uniref:4Fe-4S dicluster domain-containing protein n=1 Tax=Thiohalorhabdus methylotrophus TaxID=3242694 RepID=A0ABV4TS96_9GAMM
MAIHEKSLIDAENIMEEEDLTVDGVDVSGHWNTMIRPRYLTDYDPELRKEIAAMPQAENVHRCWQCGSCTNSCTVYALNTDFNPRYWIYLINLGLKDELLKDKDIIWQCVSCNKCTNICPKDVRPEGVMKATAHWLEENGYTDTTNSTLFDEEFTEQILERGRIEDGEVLKNFYKKSNQSLFQEWIVEMGKRMVKHLPFSHLMHMGLASVFRPKSKSWGKTGEVLREYIREQKEARQHA